jgi:hypothetical protein
MMEILPVEAALIMLKSGRTDTKKLAGWVSRPRDSPNKIFSFYVTRMLIFMAAPNILFLQLPSKYLTHDLISTPYNPSYINSFGEPPPNDKMARGTTTFVSILIQN